VGLQELKMRDEQFQAADFEAAGYRAVTHGQKAWNGVAVLSRRPAAVTQVGLPGQEDLGARLLTAEVDGLSFTTVYVPNGKNLEHRDYERKLDWLDALAGYLRERHDPSAPTVLCGDFNVVPAPIDSWNEDGLAATIFHSEPERRRFAYFAQWGLHDLFRNLHPDSKMFSWWDYRALGFPRNRGLRIDFLLGTASILERLESVRIDRDYRKKKDGLTASDHAPVIADLN
jgi:exodeoxyribonuclease-3